MTADSTLDRGGKSAPDTHWPREMLGLFCIFVFAVCSSANVAAAIPDFLHHGHGLKTVWDVLAMVAIWLLSLAMLVTAASSRNAVKWPLFVLIAISSVFLDTYRHASGTPMGYAAFDALLRARGNAGDAVHEYGYTALRPLAELVPLFAGFALTVRRKYATAIAPMLFCLSVGVFVAVCVFKHGGVTDHLPQTTALYGMAASHLFENPAAPYDYITAEQPPFAPRVHNIVIVIDESIRDDFFHRVVGPALQGGRGGWHVHDFGLATSMANCSAESNIMLRKAVRAGHIALDVYRNPLVWSYARNAGFSTWLLDAQRVGDADYFGPVERKLIDHQPDLRLARDSRILDAMHYLDGPQPSFTIIIKHGSHFPYTQNYPADFVSTSAAMRAPYVRASIKRQQYVNAIDWQTGAFFRALMDLRVGPRTMLIYTSDHGQNVADAPGFTHCSYDSVHPDEGVVPLLVVTNYESADLARAAAFNRDRASHFNIMPTALQAMGYDVSYKYRSPSGSLLEPQTPVKGFLYGSAFGYFGSPILIEPVQREKYRAIDQGRWTADGSAR